MLMRTSFSPRCRVRWALGIVTLAMASGACSSPAALDTLCAPAEIDRVLERVDRTAESQRALALAHRLEERGLADPVAAVYEFRFMRNKPVFYFAVARGNADRSALLEEARETFQGTTRAGQAPEEQKVDGASFLCVDFDRGRGLERGLAWTSSPPGRACCWCAWAPVSRSSRCRVNDR